MTPEQYTARRENLRRKMHDAGLDAMFINHEANRFYLSGFELHDPQKNESSGYLIITKDGKDWLCTDSRYTDAAHRLWDHEHVFIYSGKSANQLNGLLKRIAKGTVGFEARTMSVAFHEKISDGLNMQPADGLVERLRMIKEPEEIDAMRRSCALNHTLMQHAPSFLRPGRTEAQVAWDIEQFFRNNGASEMAFESIVAVGPNAALPHAIPDTTIITDNCPVLIDVGCRVDNYCSDQTRTFWVGDSPTGIFQSTMQLVRKAQDKAIASLRPGMSVAEAHRTARAVFEDACVDDHFTHSLGHGIGLETHEFPGVNHRTDVHLQPGMIVTIEPGLYYADWGGVRWEYMVLITEDGAEVL